MRLDGRRPLPAWPVAVLAALAYLPALTAAPGRMPADSKLYLYLDPGRFLGDAATTFDPRQFGGWVPHQHVAYLWPAGPWFWLWETLGVPDWVAHRLWIGTLLFAAGGGVYWCIRRLGLGVLAAGVGALAYQLSPYVLPYVSRTSVMLLPWAGLGWIVGLTVRATRRAGDPSRLARWGAPAAIALVVFTVGAVNATALAMIVPAPVLWLIHTAWLGEARWRESLAVAARTASATALVSVWWAVMLVIQGRSGAEILPYSESLADVSFTATSAEVWRQMGYWLFYVRDQYAPTTTAAGRYLQSSLAIGISFLIPILALTALAFVRWRHRRLAALLLAAGLVLAVGVHPIDDRSPLMRLLTGDADGGLALALRSSTRALPLAALGISLALASGVAALASHARPRLPRLAAAAVAVLLVLNLPALWNGGFVDPALARDQDPPLAWQAAADALDDPTGRVLQLPGQEFGAFEWGYTVDHPLAGMAEAPLITRDLLPLGSPAAMDLLYALDDRIQDGVLEPEAVAAVARLLGATDIWLTNDAAFDRFDVTAPGVVRRWLDAAPGLGEPVGYGAPSLNVPTLGVADARYLGSTAASEAAPDVQLYPVDGSPGVARAYGGALVVSGSGDGLVDAAAAGLLPDGVAVLYSAVSDDLAGTLAAADGLLVTDSNRVRARHWRGSQDTTGFTESAGRDGAVPTELTVPAVGDARLPVFAESEAEIDPHTATTAEQRGPVVARASAYGQPFALIPEHRPYMAVDGDLDTAWTVGEHGDPVGATFDLVLTDPAAPPSELRAVQYTDVAGQRIIDRVALDALDAAGNVLGRVADVSGLELEASIPLDLPPATTTIRITVEAVRGGEPFTAGVAAAVGFRELDLGLGPTTEVVRVPTDAVAAVGPDTPVAYVFSRLRTDPADRWRDDPEPRLMREFDVAADVTAPLTPTVRLDRRAGDHELATLFGWPAEASTHLLGWPEHAGIAAVDGDPATSWVTGFDAALGATLAIDTVTEPIGTITVRQPLGDYSHVTEVTLHGADGMPRIVALAADAAGAAQAAVEPPLPAGPLTIEISGIEPAYTTDRRFGDRFQLPAAVTELELAGLPAIPDLTDPQALTDCVPLATLDDISLAYVLTTTDRPASAPAWLGSAGVAPLVALPCASATSVPLSAGTHLLTAVDTGLPVSLDRVVIGAPFADSESPPVLTVVDRGQRERTFEITGCAGGCWVVLGEGYNMAWSAEVTSGRAERELGEPVLLDGGFTGWWVGPGDDAITVHARWTEQRPLNIAYAVSAAAVAACLVLVVLDRRRSCEVPDPAGVRTSGVWAGTRGMVALSLVWIAVAGLLCGPWGIVWGAAGAVGTVLLRDRRVPALVAAASLTALALGVVWRERQLAPLPDGGWPHAFEEFHGLGMFAVAAVIVSALTADDTGSLPSAP